LPPLAQREQQERFLHALASVHRVAWQAEEAFERRLRRGVGEELAYWDEYVEWAAAPDKPARVLADAVHWCRDHQPGTREAGSLLWGDARLGNVLFAPDGAIAGMLDWELASIGPAEMDLAWYLVLDEVTNYFARTSVPGFFAHDDAVAF